MHKFGLAEVDITFNTAQALFDPRLTLEINDFKLRAHLNRIGRNLYKLKYEMIRHPHYKHEQHMPILNDKDVLVRPHT